jgi:hypothetical protein
VYGIELDTEDANTFHISVPLWEAVPHDKDAMEPGLTVRVKTQLCPPSVIENEAVPLL